MNKKINSRALAIGVLSLYLLPNIVFIVNPMLGVLASEVYPDLSYSTVTLISTMAALTQIPGSLIAGAIVGKKIRYKTLAILSMLLVAIGGAFPFFVTDFTCSVIMRAITGFGIGISYPLQNTLIPMLFPQDKVAGLLGTGSTVMAVSGIVYQTASGYIAEIGATYPWLIHLLLIIPTIYMVMVIEEPEKASESDNAGEEKKQNKLPFRTIFCALAHCALFTAFYPLLLNVSTVVAEEGIGSASTAGIISSVYTVGGAVAGLIFGKLTKALGKFTIPFGLAAWAAGTGLFSIAKSIPMLVISFFLLGIAVQTCWPGTMNNYSLFVPIESMGMASSLYTSGLCLGCFLATYFVSMATKITGSESPRAIASVGFWVVLAVGIIWSFVEITKPAEKLAEK